MISKTDTYIVTMFDNNRHVGKIMEDHSDRLLLMRGNGSTIILNWQYVACLQQVDDGDLEVVFVGIDNADDEYPDEDDEEEE